jgi:hypothetical protein
MTDYANRMVDQIRDVLQRAQGGIMTGADAAKALDGLASAMDGSVPVAVRSAARRLANDVELVEYGGSQSSLAEASSRFEATIAPGGARDTAQR